MKKTMILLSLIFFSSAHASTKKVYPYEPSKVTLSGKMTKKTFYGPPGFGEDPEHDQIEEQYVLILDQPIDVKADKAQLRNIEEKNVKEITLVVLDFKQIPMEKFIGKKFKFQGSLYHSDNAHQHTNILMSVERRSTY